MRIMKIINSLILVLAVVAIGSQALGWQSAFVLLKPATTIAVIALIFAQPASLPKGDWWLLLLALIFCLAGDVLLLDMSRFVYGLGAFLVGHLLFLILFARLAGVQRDWLVLALLSVVVVCYWMVLRPYLDDFLIPVTGYVLVIAAMGWQAISIWRKKRDAASVLLALGAVLFVFSDSVIAWNKFLQPFWWSPVLILTTYWLAITLMTNGILRWNKIDSSSS